MSAIVYLHQHVVPAAWALLPEKMRSPAAEAMVLAICLQESRCVYRKQLKGPARGFPQFEVIGVKEVMRHPASRNIALNLLERMSYLTDGPEVQEAIADNDILAVVFARLALWRHPAPLPLQGEVDKSWEYYLSLWVPGKPHPETWAKFYQEAWSIVKGA